MRQRMCREPRGKLRAHSLDTWLSVQVRERSELGEFASLEHAAEAEAGAGARSQVAQLLAADALRAEQLGAAHAELAAARAALEARDSQARPPTLPLPTQAWQLRRAACSLLRPWRAISTPMLCDALSWLMQYSADGANPAGQDTFYYPANAMEPGMPCVSARASWHKEA